MALPFSISNVVAMLESFKNVSDSFEETDTMETARDKLLMLADFQKQLNDQLNHVIDEKLKKCFTNSCEANPVKLMKVSWNANLMVNRCYPHQFVKVKDGKVTNKVYQPLYNGKYPKVTVAKNRTIGYHQAIEMLKLKGNPKYCDAEGYIKSKEYQVDHLHHQIFDWRPSQIEVKPIEKNQQNRKGSIWIKESDESYDPHKFILQRYYIPKTGDMRDITSLRICRKTDSGMYFQHDEQNKELHSLKCVDNNGNGIPYKLTYKASTYIISRFVEIKDSLITYIDGVEELVDIEPVEDPLIDDVD